MESEKLILSIDIGTTSLKTAVYDLNGTQIAAAVTEYSLYTPETNIVEAPAGIYMESIKKGLQSCTDKGADLKKVAVAGFSVQSETLVLVDKDGQPLGNAIVWMDNRAGAQAEEMRKAFGDELCYEVTGQVSFEANWPAPKLLWVKENEPERFEKTAKFLLLEDYIIYLLTGKYAAEASLLTSTEYWDIRTGKYWPEMLEFLGITEDRLPEVHESAEVIGTILPGIAAELGINPEALITTGCMDQVAGAIGVGNIRPEIFSENIGAALAVCVPVEKLTYDPNRRMPVHRFALPGSYMMHTFTTGGMCLRWFRDNFCMEEMDLAKLTGIDAYDLMNKEVEQVAPGADGLICLPHLQGALAPDVNLNAKGVFYGATLKHTKAHFIRAVMESLGFIILRNFEAISEMGIDIKQLRTMGGGSKSEVWNQIKADITGKTLNVTYSSQDTACLGAAILAGTAAGYFESVESAVDSMVKIRRTYEPDPVRHEMYMKQYKKYKKLFDSLSELFLMDAED